MMRSSSERVTVAIPAPTSLTHQHLAVALASECRSRPSGSTVRVLDAGCGDGRLLAVLHTALPELAGHLNWDLFGFDVVDSTSNRGSFPVSTIERLSGGFQDSEWDDRICACSIHDPWPFADEYFDVVVSNQVLEHVQMLGPFLGQLRRVLAPGGRSYHLFPLRNCLFEGHVLLPLAAQITGCEQRRSWVRLQHARGIGRSDHRVQGEVGSRRAADYVHISTHYRSWRHFVAASKPHGPLASYRYTSEFYIQKMRQLAKRPLLNAYRTDRRPFRDAIAFSALRYVSSICLVLERPPPIERAACHH